MIYNVILQNSETGQVYEITSLCTAIKHDTFLDGQPGKLEFDIKKDPNEALELSNGSVVAFNVDGEGIFMGYIFSMSTNESGTYTVKAYDQLRYLKNKDVYITKDATASQIFETICGEAGLSYKTKFNASYVCPTYLHDNQTLYSMIEYGIQLELINAGNKCFVRDDYGTIVFSELEQEKTDLVIGDASLLTGYKYEVDIDKDTYNEVKIVKDNEETGKREIWIEYDSETQQKWGKLRLLQKAAKDDNEAQIKELADKLLRLKNSETRSMKLSSLGDNRIKAGSGFILNIESLGVQEYMWVSSVTHTYAKDSHKMELEVFV